MATDQYEFTRNNMTNEDNCSAKLTNTETVMQNIKTLQSEVEYLMKKDRDNERTKERPNIPSTGIIIKK